MVYIAYYTEFILQICDYAQKRRIWREICKYALDENFHCHFCSRWKAAKFCHPASEYGFLQNQCLESKSIKQTHGRWAEQPELVYSCKASGLGTVYNYEGTSMKIDIPPCKLRTYLWIYEYWKTFSQMRGFQLHLSSAQRIGSGHSGIGKKWVAGRLGSNGSIDIFTQVFPGTLCTLRYFQVFQVSYLSLLVWV